MTATKNSVMPAQAGIPILRFFAFGDPKSGEVYKSVINQGVSHCPESSQFRSISRGYGINFERKATERHNPTLLGLRIDVFLLRY